MDVSDLDNVRFCYVRLDGGCFVLRATHAATWLLTIRTPAHFTIEEEGDIDEDGDFMAPYVPLTGRQYLRGYYRPGMAMWNEAQDTVRALEKYELIDVHTLDSESFLHIFPP